MDAPNVALDHLMSLMALPCTNKGCMELLYLNKMESHLESCKFRLQPCPNRERGCKVRLQAKVGSNHLSENMFGHPSSGRLLAYEAVWFDGDATPSHPKAVNSKEH